MYTVKYMLCHISLLQFSPSLSQQISLPTSWFFFLLKFFDKPLNTVFIALMWIGETTYLNMRNTLATPSKVIMLLPLLAVNSQYLQGKG